MVYDSEWKISAGSYDLNKFLYGGYEKGIITTIYGPAGSGKTNFCIIAAASQVKKGNKVIYLDTEGGFSVERFKQIVGENYKDILQNIILIKATSFEEQSAAISKILAELKSRGKIGLVIADSMTMLYRLKLAEIAHDPEKIKKINTELARQLRMFTEIARKLNIAVLVTNQVYFDFGTSEKEREAHMVGGDILKYWSKCLLELKNDGARKHMLVVKKHRSLPEKSLSFIIDNKTIRKRGWI
ncbi:DNA repair and recombination protein RadB [Candidatus Pacearchaeota archaeon]|nr:DNA repair and recombination protein RadB [Candidatus Pacearchaeota archaeon]